MGKASDQLDGQHGWWMADWGALDPGWGRTTPRGRQAHLYGVRTSYITLTSGRQSRPHMPSSPTTGNQAVFLPRLLRFPSVGWLAGWPSSDWTHAHTPSQLDRRGLTSEGGRRNTLCDRAPPWPQRDKSCKVPCHPIAPAVDVEWALSKSCTAVTRVDHPDWPWSVLGGLRRGAPTEQG